MALAARESKISVPQTRWACVRGGQGDSVLERSVQRRCLDRFTRSREQPVGAPSLKLALPPSYE